MTETPSEQHLHQTMAIVLHDHDVLHGRGASINKHPGNLWYRRRVHDNRKLYKICERHDKLIVAKTIVQMVHSRNPPGRFLEQAQPGGVWIPVSYDKAVNKASQALRGKVLRKRIKIDTMASFPQLAIAPSSAREFLGGTSSEAETVHGKHRAIQIQNDMPVIEPRALQQTSLSLRRQVYEKPRTEGWVELLPKDQQNTHHFTKSSRIAEDETAHREFAKSTMTLTSQQSALSNCDASQENAFLESGIDLSIESAQLLNRHETQFGRAHLMEPNSMAHFRPRVANVSVPKRTNEGSRSRDIFEHSASSNHPGVETLAPTSTRIHSQMSPSFPPSRIERNPARAGRRSNCATHGDDLDPGQQLAKRIQDVNSEARLLTLPQQAASPVLGGYANLNTEMPHASRTHPNEASNFSTNTSISDGPKVELATRSSSLASYHFSSPFARDNAHAMLKGRSDQSTEPMHLSDLDHSGNGSVQVSDLRNCELDLKMGKTPGKMSYMLPHIDAKLCTDEVERQSTAQNPRDATAGLWSSLFPTLAESSPHDNFDCASTFCSNADSNQTSPFYEEERAVINAERAMASAPMRSDPVFDALNQLSSQSQERRALENNGGAGFIHPLLATPTFSAGGPHSGILSMKTLINADKSLPHCQSPNTHCDNFDDDDDDD